MLVTTSPLSLMFFRGHVAYLRQHGFEVHAVSAPGKELDEFSATEGVTTHRVPMERRIAPLRDLLALLRLWRLFADLRPGLVHVMSPKAGLLAPIAARLTGRPSIVVSLFGLPQMTGSRVLRTVVDTTTRLSTFLADKVWCDSHSMRDFVVSTGLSAADKTIVLGSGSVAGVDTDGVFSPACNGPDVRSRMRAEFGIPGTAVALGFVGRITRAKGIEDLARAWQRLRIQYSELHLLLVGPEEAGDPISERARGVFASDSRVHAVGFRADVAACLSAVDISVMPSYREGFGITNLEASAMGLPVVSTRIPGCVDSVEDGVTGTLVPPGDAAALEQAIRTYLDYPELRARHGSAGRARAERYFRPERLWEGLLETYLGLLDGRERRAR